MATTNAANRAERTGGDPAHELDAPPWLRVESTLMATANAIRDEYDVRLAPIGLTLSTASLLSYIGEFGPVSQTRAAEHLGQGRAVTGTQVDKLEALGLVERRPDPADRRVWLVAITEPGAELAAAVADIDAVFRTDLRDGISRSDRQTLAALLVRLHQNIRTHHRSPDRSDNQTEEET
jgi:MarR family transcriptional regulator for hemolysin